MKIESLVQYQADWVVSRTLIDKKAGTVTVFSFDEGQGLSEHVAPYDAFVYIFDGEAEITIARNLAGKKWWDDNVASQETARIEGNKEI